MIYEEYQTEQQVPGRRLGRHVKHDSRSLLYPFKASSIPLVSARWSVEGDPVLDQLDVGSCVGNASVGTTICSNHNPLHSALSDEQRGGLNEDLAVRVYSLATELDDFPGTYPPEDTGSDGLDGAKAMTKLGYITGYTHTFSLNDALAALTLSPVILGINWYAGMDNPTQDGSVSATGTIRGGHEVCLDEIDVEHERVWIRNSWSAGWGIRGRANLSFTGLGTLLSQDGDVTVFAPLSVPAPTPVPTPPEVDYDSELAALALPWTEHKKTYPPNEKLRLELIQWLKARGYTS
jgi:hypothetical protein